MTDDRAAREAEYEALRLAKLREGYFYVADETGKEVPGSRRDLDRCRSVADAMAIRADLDAKKGEDCMVRHSHEGQSVPW